MRASVRLFRSIHIVYRESEFSRFAIAGRLYEWRFSVIANFLHARPRLYRKVEIAP